jgi:hypothetical protein
MTLHRRAFLKQLGFGAAGLGLVSSFPAGLYAQKLFGGKLPRSTPEAEGVDSQGILDFLEAIGASKHEFHSFMMVRHGRVIAEGWWSPYRAEFNHTLYSLSKSFTSTAIGLAVTDGKLTVEDPVISFFPDDLPAKVSDHLGALRVKHLLTMSVGHAEDSTPVITKEQDWVRTFLALPIKNEPGSIFLYNSGATYMLSAIVQKATGQKVVDYLTPRLFAPLDIEDMTWETCPHGINTGGWGLSVRTEGLAKFAQLYLQRGTWQGRPLLPANWVEEATSFKIQQPGADLERLKKESDWHQGYCYQFWRCRHNAFRGDGAFGQYAIVMPDQNAVVAITSESADMHGELNLVWRHLLPAIKEKALPADKNSQAELQRKLASLVLPPLSGKAASPIAAKVSGKVFALESNDLGAQSVTFDIRSQACVFTLKDEKKQYPIVCGLGTWMPGETSMPGTPPRLVSGKAATNSRVAASYRWKDDDTLEMLWRYCETPHHDAVTCHFEGEKIRIEFMNSISQMNSGRKEKRPVLQGELSA